MIVNKTKKTLLTKNKKILKNNFSKSLGLMFSKKINNRGLIFEFKKEKTHSIHMLFVFFPIDILFLNKNKEVVEIKENLNPFSFYTSKKHAKYFIELPAGAVKRTKTKLNNTLSFKS